MPAAQATIFTSRAAAYLTRLCGHAGKMSAAATRLHHRPRAHAGGTPPHVQHVQHDGDEATVTLDCGQWTMHAGPGQLRIRAQAPEQDSLRRIQDLLTHRSSPSPAASSSPSPGTPAPDPKNRPARLTPDTPQPARSPQTPRQELRSALPAAHASDGRPHPPSPGRRRGSPASPPRPGSRRNHHVRRRAW